MEFDKYFLTECNVYLHHLEYDMLTLGGEPKLMVTDSVASYDLDEEKVRIEIARSVSAANNKLFYIKAVYGIILTKNPLVINEMDWSSVNVADEFKKSKKNLMNNIASRLSMLIANVTSSSGVIPVITPPQIIGQ